jgi:hypothetical protein
VVIWLLFPFWYFVPRKIWQPCFRRKPKYFDVEFCQITPRPSFIDLLVFIQNQGCEMVYFQTKNTNLGKFWRALEWKMLVCFMNIWNILRTLGIFYDLYISTFCFHLVCFSPFWYTVARKIWQPW